MSEPLSYWECERLLERWRVTGTVRPDVSWAEALWRRGDGPHAIEVLEPIRTKAPCWAQPWVCLHTTVQFLGRRRPFEEIERVDLEPRTWPNTHFVLHKNRIFEVGGGHVVHLSGGWMMAWRAWANSTHARHFNVTPAFHAQDNCDICRLERNLREAA